MPKFAQKEAPGLSWWSKCADCPMTINLYKLTLLLLVFLIVSLLLMRFELLPLVSSCFSPPLLFILLFNEFLLFTEFDLDRLVAAKKYL